jgi:hypothetical protein
MGDVIVCRLANRAAQIRQQFAGAQNPNFRKARMATAESEVMRSQTLPRSSAETPALVVVHVN